MNQISLPIAIRKSYPVLEKMLVVPIALFAYLGLVCASSNFSIAPLFFVFALLSGMLYFEREEILSYLSDYVNVLGSMKLTEDEIIVLIGEEKVVYDFNDISRIYLNINETSRDKRFRWIFNKRLTGLNNSAEIILLNQVSRTYNLYIDSSLQIEEIDAFLKKFESQKIVLRRRTFGMDLTRVDSIKETHYKSYPKEYWDTSPKNKNKKN